MSKKQQSDPAYYPPLGMVDLDYSSEGADRRFAKVLAKIKGPWEAQAELYVQGLKAQVDEREKALLPKELLQMICVQGNERFEVRSVSMPSHNVVALHCVDSDGETVQLTGHMNAISFTFRVRKMKEPVKKSKIGFTLGS